MSLYKIPICTFFSAILFGCSNFSGIATNSLKMPLSQTAETETETETETTVKPSKLAVKEHQEKNEITQSTNKQTSINKPDEQNDHQEQQKAPLPDKKDSVEQEQLREKDASPQPEALPAQEPKDLALEKALPTEPEIKADKKTEVVPAPVEETRQFEPQTFPDFYAPEKFGHPLQHSKKLTFMIGEDSKGSYLYGEGPIIEGAYDKFLKYVNHYQKLGINLDRLMLHSPGGVLNEGILIGEYILKNQWNTDADKYMRCYSTCGFIYAAGSQKRIQSGAEVGFHRPYLPNKADTPEFIEQVYKEYQNYWKAVSGSPALYNKFMREYGRHDMYILNNRNIQKYMIVEKY
ncbi:hypothetical protein [Vibrio rhodolitus]|uniref:hypothetical protein n=1 Tax=Vibrio rhodolitus TaxID=2231649 RepID=UPI000E0C2893|nr:hypothetical protein [Vibrio rhodolitus]